MKTITYKNIKRVDRSAWLKGPWDDEPEDKMQWQHKETGLPCLMVRNQFGAWCGYVGVPEGHPAFGKHYDDGVLAGILVHGGLTFADHCQENDKEEGVCHVPAAGEPDNVWWLGFDTAHWQDAYPAMSGRMLAFTDGDKPTLSYKTMKYTKRQVGQLAKQLKAME